MTAYAPTVIRRAVRELLQGEIGTLRTLTQGVFKYGTFEGQPDGAEQALSSMGDVGQHWFDVKLGRLRPAPWTPSSALGSYRGGEQPLTVTVTTRLATTVQEDDRDEVRELALRDIELAGQALGMPGNLLADSDGNETGIVSGCSQNEPETELVSEDWDQLLLRSRIECVFPIAIDQEV